MRIWKIAISGVLAAILLLTAVAPAIAAPETKDKVQVQFQNKTGSSVRITLTGPATVYLTLNTGKTKTEMIPGTYRYSYNACGTTNTGTFKVKAGANLALPKCKSGGGGSAGEKKQAITNNTGGTLTMILSGPHSYTFYVATGRSQISLVKGTYNYTIYGCGAVLTGSRKLPGGGNWVFWCY